MITTRWDDIDADTVRGLCDDGAAESATLDFKRTAPAKQRDDHRNEFAKDVCAFANAGGGDLVYGVGETPVGPFDLCPIADEPFDACKRRLSEVLANHVEPRISGVQYKEVPVDTGYVLIVRVPQSFDGPHRYRVPNQSGVPAHHRFVYRADSGTADMDFSQLRDAFGRTASLADRARRFRVDRIDELRRRTPRRMRGGPMWIVHFVPLSGLARGSLVDIPNLYRSELTFTPAGGRTPEKIVNLDGILMPGPPNESGESIDWYHQVFRNGAMEFVRKAWSQVNSDTPYIPANFVSKMIRDACALALNGARSLGINGPATLTLSCLAVEKHPFTIANGNAQYGNWLADRPDLLLPEQWIDEVSAAVDLDVYIRPLLDALWQCFGELQCHDYSNEGVWQRV